MKITNTDILNLIQARQSAMKSGKAGMFTTTELCMMLSVTKQTISAWVAKDSIPHFRLGTLLRFDPGQLAEWIEQR